MGAIKQSNVIYLTVSDGRIVRRFQSPTAESVQRTTKEGKIVYEEFYKGWKGLITDIQFKDHAEYGRFLNVTLDDGVSPAVLQMKLDSGYATAFLKTLPNVDLESEVILTPSMKIEGDKKKTSFFVSQHGVALKWYYNKENPNGLPELKKIKVKGKEVWDSSDMIEFLENMVKETILPKLKPKESSEVDEDEAPF